MNRVLTTFAVVLLSLGASAQGSASAISDQAPAADLPTDQAAPDAASSADTEKEFKPAPGFKAKKFGDKVLYCKKDTSVGTRFKTEKCLDEAQMRDFILSQEQNNRDFDRARAICSNPAICAPE